jgi:2-hydroxychromene-2-carboxylate isomerase
VNPPADAAPVIHFYCSLRSPYTYLAAAQVRALAAHYGATVHLRFVLPMVMRGLPVPLAKRLYILRDAKREAKRLGLDFGCVVDPVGKPVENGLALLYAAEEQGRGAQMLESFLQGVFADGIDAGSAQGLQHIAERAGMQAGDIQQALRNDAWREQAESNRADMFARGVWGVPAFRVNEGPVLWGQDRLWMLEEDLLAALSERKP